MEQGKIRNLIDTFNLCKPEGALHGDYNVLTVRQPYATMLVSGMKDYEFRRWPIPKHLISEPILIHAAASILNARIAVSEEDFEFYKQYAKSRNLFGCIVGIVVFGDPEPSDTPPFSGYRFPVMEFFRLGRPIFGIKGREKFWKITL